MAKSQKSGTPPVKKQTTEPTTPAPVVPEAPTTNPPNDPTVVPPTTDPNVSDPNVDDSDLVDDGADKPATEPEQPEQVAVSEGMKRKELDAVAAEAGLTNVSKYKDKSVVVSAIERVRAGEDAAAVDGELTPEVPEAGAGTEVEAVNPFYDLEGKKTRKAGDKFKVTETRAAELRGHKLIK